MKTALTIAGSDSSGGAGIQADIKTMTMNGVYATSTITALTAQNTTGVYGIMEVSPEFLENQLDCVFADIYPDAIKTGMVASAALIEVISRKLTEYGARNIVVDPVMISTSGSRLLAADAMEALENRLFPLADLITPNIPEAGALCRRKIGNMAEMELAARMLHERYGCAVLLKGGHSVSDANDYLYADGRGKWIEGRRINNSNTHGTGCTLSSAIAANLAKGCGMEEAVCRAKEYISGALAAMLDLGKGDGPLNHMFDLSGRFAEEGKKI